MVELVIDGELVRTTADHPFYTAYETWVEAGDLEVGDHILSAAGDYGRVTSVRTTSDREMMYNLTVSEDHTYVVGSGQWVVHNTCTVGFNNINFRRENSVNGYRTRVDDETATVRVGRWMSNSEYNTMRNSGQVQPGSDGAGTYILLDGPANFESQARPGSVYVEFDVRANDPWFMTNDGLGWAIIPTPGSSQANRWRIATGETITSMPAATSISEILFRK